MKKRRIVLGCLMAVVLSVTPVHATELEGENLSGTGTEIEDNIENEDGTEDGSSTGDEGGIEDEGGTENEGGSENEDDLKPEFFIYELQEDGTAIITGYNEEAEFPELVEIPKQIDEYNVSAISGTAFSDCDKLIKITIPNSVTKVGYGAFNNCENLEYVMIGKNAVNVDCLFVNCPKLLTAGPVGGGYNIEYGWTTRIPYKAFYDCDSLNSVAFPDSIVSIGGLAFYDCDSLERVTLPKSLTTLDKNTFNACDNLEYVRIPQSLTEFSHNSHFKNCPRLKTAGHTSGNYNIEFEWMTEIPEYAFYECNYLTKYNLPGTVTFIGSNAFGACKSLTSVTFPRDLKKLGPSVFWECDGLTEVVLPENLELGYCVFDSCNNLEKLVIPASIVSKNGIATNCPKLKTAGPVGGDYNIEFEWSKEIPDYAFLYCNSIENVELPHEVTRLGYRSFYGCSGLKKVEVPWAVTTIGNDCFRGCGQLTIYGVEGTTAEEYAAANNIPFVIVTGLPFDDVSYGDWFYNAVDFVEYNGLMTGMNETTFGPAELLSRAQFAVILWRMNGSPEVEYVEKFPDVPEGIWYTDAVLWANEKGIITGYAHNGEFGPADNITREQMALMMHRYGNAKEYDVIQRAEFDSFVDAERVSSFAKEAMQWTVAKEIITGKQNGTALEPQGNASRAECATIIMRFMNQYE